MPDKSLRNTVRGGFSFLELQVAFVLFAIALAGLVPLVVMQSRQLQRLEARFDENDPDHPYYLVPSTDAWARKLGAAASIAETPTHPIDNWLPRLTLIDNADSGYNETEAAEIDWQSASSGNAFQGQLRWNNGGYVGDKATWEFTGLEPGRYQVLVTFAEAPDQATDAPYRVYDGAVYMDTQRVDQTQTPSGPTLEGSPWETLGAFSITSDTLRVELSDDANGKIVADAVGIVRVVQVLSLDKSLASEAVTAEALVQVP